MRPTENRKFKFFESHFFGRTEKRRRKKLHCEQFGGNGKTPGVFLLNFRSVCSQQIRFGSDGKTPGVFRFGFSVGIFTTKHISAELFSVGRFSVRRFGRCFHNKFGSAGSVFRSGVFRRNFSALLGKHFFVRSRFSAPLWNQGNTL